MRWTIKIIFSPISFLLSILTAFLTFLLGIGTALLYLLMMFCIFEAISTSCFLKIFILKKRKQKTSQRLKNHNIIPKMILKT